MYLTQQTAALQWANKILKYGLLFSSQKLELMSKGLFFWSQFLEPWLASASASTRNLPFTTTWEWKVVGGWSPVSQKSYEWTCKYLQFSSKLWVIFFFDIRGLTALNLVVFSMSCVALTSYGAKKTLNFFTRSQESTKKSSKSKCHLQRSQFTVSSRLQQRLVQLVNFTVKL